MILVQLVSLLILKGVVEFYIKDYLKKVIWPILLVVGLTFYFPFIVTSVYPSTLVRMILTISSSLLVVLVVIYFCGLNNSEKLFVKKIIKRVTTKK